MESKQTGPFFSVIEISKSIRDKTDFEFVWIIKQKQKMAVH